MIYEVYTDGYECGGWDRLASWNDADGEDLWAGNLYVLVHTTTQPDGEIRGQLEWIPTALTTESSWGRIRALWR